MAVLRGRERAREQRKRRVHDRERRRGAAGRRRRPHDQPVALRPVERRMEQRGSLVGVQRGWEGHCRSLLMTAGPKSTDPTDPTQRFPHSLRTILLFPVGSSSHRSLTARKGPGDALDLLRKTREPRIALDIGLCRRDGPRRRALELDCTVECRSRSSHKLSAGALLRLQVRAELAVHSKAGPGKVPARPRLDLPLRRAPVPAVHAVPISTLGNVGAESLLDNERADGRRLQ